MEIEIKDRYTGEVLFSHECENNTVKITLIKANLSNADLRSANLRSANLSNANLRSANLWNADLWNADLSSANLRSANLRSANLRSANLSNADLRSANLRSANLSNAYLMSANLWNANLWNADNIEKAKGIPMYCKWSHGITNNNLIHIGCEKRTIEEWDDFFESTEVLTTDRDTPEFRQIQAVYEGYKAYLTFLGGNHFRKKP